jgi:phage shock protein E
MFSFLRSIFASKGPSIQDLLTEGALVVDVRTPGEFRTGHGTESQNIPLQSLQNNINSLKKQNKVVVTCCASGMRSAKAAKWLRQAGIEAHNGGSWQTVERLRRPQ